MQSLQRSNPEIDIWPIYLTQGGVFFFNWTLPPTVDVMVRKALQMAVDRDTMAESFFKGFGAPAPYGLVKQDGPGGYSWPYEEWPDEVKHEYEYHPEEAEALLDEAGYPRGADGYRFKVQLAHFDRWDETYPEVIMGYLDAIGVDSELEVMPIAEIAALGPAEAHDWALVTAYYGWWCGTNNLGYTVTSVTSIDGSNSVNKAKDQRLDALYLAAQETTDIEELKSIYRQADEICVREHCALNKSTSPLFFLSQPWVEGYFGEAGMGWGERNTFQARLWIDQELKEAMGQ